MRSCMRDEDRNALISIERCLHARKGPNKHMLMIQVWAVKREKQAVNDEKFCEGREWCSPGACGLCIQMRTDDRKVLGGM